MGGPEAKARARRLWAWPVAWAGLSFVVWAVFALSIAAPVVVSDEVLFLITAMSGSGLAAARQMGAAVQDSNALLYPAVLRLLALGHLPVETAAKLLNAAVFAGAAGLAAGLGRPRPQDRPPWVLSAYLGLAPVGTYAAYLMPEALYFGGFILLLLTISRSTVSLKGVAAAGAIGAGLTLVKPHGLIVAVAVGLAIVLWAWARRQGLKGAALRLGAFAAAYAAVLGLGLWAMSPAAAADAGPGLVGARYGGQLAYLLGGLGHVAAGLRLSGRYLAGLLLLLAPCAVITLACLVKALRAREPGEGDGRAFAALVTVLTLALLLIVVPQVVTNEADRIHLRYLNFASLALVPLAVGMAAGRAPSARLLRLAALVWLASVIAMALVLPSYRPLPVDSPELFFLAPAGGGGSVGPARAAGWAMLGLIGVAALAMASGRVGWRAAQFTALFVTAALSIANVHKIDGVWAAANAPARALGRTAQAACKPGRSRLIAVGTPNNFVLLYVPLHVLARPIPLLIKPEAEGRAALSSLRSGDCVLTTLTESSPRFSLLGVADTGKLYKVR